MIEKNNEFFYFFWLNRNNEDIKLTFDYLNYLNGTVNGSANWKLLNWILVLPVLLNW